MPPEPRELTKKDLASADDLMAEGIFRMDVTLSSTLGSTLGHPIPGIEVRFQDLQLSATVPQIRNGSLEVPTLWSKLQQGVSKVCLKSKQVTVEKKILRGLTGSFKPGRTTLILGQPGAGKSSLMKVLANRFHMEKNITLSGDVDYNGKHLQETLDFAHQCCSGSSLEPWVVKVLRKAGPEQQKHALELMNAHHTFSSDLTLQMFGLENCKDTIVGNAMLRGVSGGERKRVTTGEMMFGPKRLLLLDEISTGLDSAATYDICKAMKSKARSFNAAVVISLLQPLPEVLDLFDDVLLMNNGRIMYHGERAEAVPYFARMGFHCPPNKNAADFLLDLCTNKMGEYVLGQIQDVPYHSSEFAARFRESNIFRAAQKEFDRPIESMAVFADHRPFRQRFNEDLVTLLRRQLTFTIRDVGYLMGQAITVTAMGLLRFGNGRFGQSVDAGFAVFVLDIRVDEPGSTGINLLRSTSRLLQTTWR
ncbi:unnamed protein product [Phytophthora lilii]|uniref:Unnamed protein product n=1 Tax=Phytophthora lilii TaxID=2077276 RepID=A0A9W6TP61_9STRA|nr:unnamed protein product [Phytophthora lilii]